MRGDKKGLGRILFLEWVFPLKDYYLSTSQNELIFENLMPIIIAAITTIICECNKVVALSTDKLAEILLTLTSVLIGFSVMLVTLLLTSSGDGVNVLKEKKTSKKIYDKSVNLFQKLHIQFVTSLINEIILLLLVLLYYFISGMIKEGVWQCAFLLVFVYMILFILLSIMRGITNVYFSYYISN